MGKEMDARQYIRIRGANENNLKNIDVDIPRNELVVLTGLSGSGKSSLAFDTIYAEGQTPRSTMADTEAQAPVPQAMVSPLPRSHTRIFRWVASRT